jgi:hypothetical protein
MRACLACLVCLVCLACLACLAAWLYVPFAEFGQIDYDRHVIFDNSLADGS